MDQVYMRVCKGVSACSEFICACDVVGICICMDQVYMKVCKGVPVCSEFIFACDVVGV